MRSILVLLACLVTSLAAADKNPADPRLEKALAQVEQKLPTKFEIPFPSDKLDPDAYRVRPFGIVTTGDKKVSASKPLVNPYDGAGTIEWFITSEDVKQIGAGYLDVFMHFDANGDFLSISLVADPDRWPVDKAKGTGYLRREKDEAGFKFYHRAIETYRERAKNAKDPAQAAAFLQAFDKMARAVQASYREVLAEPKEGQ